MLTAASTALPPVQRLPACLWEMVQQRSRPRQPLALLARAQLPQAHLRVSRCHHAACGHARHPNHAAASLEAGQAPQPEMQPQLQRRFAELLASAVLVREALGLVSYKSLASGHSLCVGPVSQAVMQGILVWTIRLVWAVLVQSLLSWACPARQAVMRGTLVLTSRLVLAVLVQSRLSWACEEVARLGHLQ